MIFPALIFSLSASPRRRCRLLAVALLALAGALRPTQAADNSKEYDVKAALLYNFTQFVDWPADSFASAEAPLVIGIIGRDPFGDTLEKLVEREHVDTHRIVVQQCRNMVEAGRCQILFISITERDKLQQILNGLEKRPILTVAEFDGFIGRGGMVRLYRNSENKIRVRINLEAAKAAGLTMSAKLLRVVEVVPPDEE